jgi:UDP-4-amino-4,6-dideoxy-N-acetyl-beta-L-altrosamine N-acetyltransferase
MESVYLRVLELGDLDRTYKWHNDPELYRTMGVFHYVSRATDEEWLRKKQAFSTSEVNLAICLSSNSQHIGDIYLRNIDWIARHAELHVFIAEPDQRSKGYGQAAVRLLIKHAFQNLGLQRLHLLVLEDNKPAIKVYEKCGFVVEGRLRRHVFKNGKFKDVLFMGLCAGDTPPGEA